jgi:hypothetical protein
MKKEEGERKLEKGKYQAKINAKKGKIKAKRPRWESKMTCRKGKKYYFQRGDKIVFGPKYRPLRGSGSEILAFQILNSDPDKK